MKFYSYFCIKISFFSALYLKGMVKGTDKTKTAAASQSESGKQTQAAPKKTNRTWEAAQRLKGSLNPSNIFRYSQ